nr:helix-turn-helix transcriptional regulator [Prevotellamassilia timonensis]
MSTHLSDWGSYQKRTLRQNLTQDELGERIGVQKAQISRMERGYSIWVFYKLRDKERSKESAYVFNLIFRTPL